MLVMMLMMMVMMGGRGEMPEAGRAAVLAWGSTQEMSALLLLLLLLPTTSLLDCTLLPLHRWIIATCQQCPTKLLLTADNLPHSPPMRSTMKMMILEQRWQLEVDSSASSSQPNSTDFHLFLYLFRQIQKTCSLESRNGHLKNGAGHKHPG